jgi:hypothetical protein
MTDDRHDFSDRLIQCESPTPALHDKYRKEIAAMFRKELSPLGRAAWTFWAVFGLTLAIVFGYAAVVSYVTLPLWCTVGFGAGVVFGLTFGGPGRLTTTLSFWAWENGLRFNRFGFASAISYVMVIVAIIMITILLRYLRVRREDAS